MKRLFSTCLVASLGVSCVQAGPTEAAIIAMMRLSDEPNYSWVATVSDDARTYDILGQTIRDGFTKVRMPVINSVRRQLRRSVMDTEVDFVFRGNVRCVINTEDGWKRPAELPLLPLNEAVAAELVGPIRPTQTATLGPGQLPRTSIVRMPRVADPRDGRLRAYSNLQLAISHPHEDLGVIIGSCEHFKVEGNIVSGSLTDLGAELLLVRDGQKYIQPLRAAGSFKVWLRDGRVAKYQVKLEGALNVHLPTGKRIVEVRQVTDTIVKEVGTTSFEIPAEAVMKLGT